MPALYAYGHDVAETPETKEATDGSVSDYENGETTVFGVQNAEVYTGVSGTGYKRKEPYLSLLLSCVYPGIGQFYNGQVAKGIIMTSLATAGSVVMGIGLAEMQLSQNSYDYDYDYDEGGAKLAMGLLVYSGILIWSIIDAPVSAGKINRRNAALTWNVGDGAQLKLRPDISYENPVKGLQLRKELYYGLSCRMEF
jgi:hypothetical protein